MATDNNNLVHAQKKESVCVGLFGCVCVGVCVCGGGGIF